MAQANPVVAENNVRGRVGPSEATRAARDEARAMNSSRHVPRLPSLFQKASDANKIYIFNVGPWMQERLMGSLGAFRIPACPEGEQYGGPVVIDGVCTEYYPVSETKMDPLMDEGEYIAQQVIGVGAHLSPNNSFLPYGVFMSRSNPPQKSEIDAARLALRNKCLALKSEADIAYAHGPKMAEDTIQPNVHFTAARILGLSEVDCPWMKNAVLPAERDTCPGCGATYKVGVMKCRECGYILEKAKYEKAVKDGLFAA